MPIVADMQTRYQKYVAKMSPDRVGTRYDAVKDIALNRYLEGVALIRPAVEHAKAILDELGVPPGEYGLYLAFIQSLLSKMRSYNGKTFENVVLGMKQMWINKGADPTILDTLINLVTGKTPK